MNHTRTINDWFARFEGIAPHKHCARARNARSLGLCATTFVMMIALSGCIALDDSTPDRLPDPTIQRVEPRVLDEDQQKRRDEVDQYLFDRYKSDGWQIVDTTQTYIGDIIDWLDPASVPGSQEEPPPSPSPEEMQLPKGAQLQVTELDLYPELRGPDGTIPMTRPSFAVYVLEDTGASSVEDFLEKNQVPGQPDGQNRLYSGLIAANANTGVVSWINDFGEIIEPRTFSLIEMATVCPGPNPDETMELVGAATSRDWRNFDDWVLRIQVEFLTAGLQAKDLVGGWDGKKKGFVALAGRAYGPGMALAPVSIVGEIQYTSRIEIRLSDGKWWISHNGNWLGYYPSALFDLIPSSGCEAHWYGEVFDPTPMDWTWTNMGSGLFPSGSFGQAAYVMTPFYKDILGVSQWPDSAFGVSPSDTMCYSKPSLVKGGLGQERYFFLGGPGGDAIGCD